MSNEVYNINKKTTKLPPHFLEQRISVKYNELSVIIFYYGINLDIPFTTIKLLDLTEDSKIYKLREEKIHLNLEIQ